MKRLSEYLGESYYNSLTQLKDLVLIMDESHHYRADRGMAVLNELRPILGLELTATPQIQSGGKKVPFKNVVFDYPLGAAMQDGYVKDPIVATRKDFDPSHHSPEKLDRIKLEDGIRIHENLRTDITLYCRDNDEKKVKPFVLIVAKDTTHAGELIHIIKSPAFFGGYYASRVMEIHSNQRGGEKNETIQKLITVEDPDNPIEIVIHVNMLKEGWDVTNLYTIIPLRRSASDTLTEQTIGRGLHLPFGRRMGVNALDKLYIVSHDKFQQIVDEANKPDSIINTTQIITMENLGLEERSQTIITSDNTLEAELKNRLVEIDQSDKTEKEKAEETFKSVTIPQAVSEYMHNQKIIHSTAELEGIKAKKELVQEVKKTLQNEIPVQYKIKIDQIITEVRDRVISHILKWEIQIPNITVEPETQITIGFKAFDLDTSSKFRYQLVSEEILQKNLADKDAKLETLITGRTNRFMEDPRNILAGELSSYPEIDYDQHAELIYKLAAQAIEAISTGNSEENTLNIIWNHKLEITEQIHNQMNAHFFQQTTTFKINIANSFSPILPHNLTLIEGESQKHYSTTIEKRSEIRRHLFTNFKKSCHAQLKFDSKPEKDFAQILEEEPNSPVIKWLRPAKNQFPIWWGTVEKHSYEPDFVAETGKAITMIEIKAAKDLEDPDVQAKAKAALEYCKRATEYNAQNGEKPWQYALIPDNRISLQRSFEGLVKQYGLT